jgi:short-subunit dehydrogenase
MLLKNHGHIVTTASMAGHVGSCRMTDYCSSKFAAVGLHESLVEELRASNKTGIKTTVICPAGVNTGLFEGLELK